MIPILRIDSRIFAFFLAFIVLGIPGSLELRAQSTSLSSSAILGSPRVPDGTYIIKNHPDGGARTPYYCLRLDRLYGNFDSDPITFDCEDSQSSVTMTVSGSTIHIFGTVYGGRDQGSTYDPNNSGLWDIDYTFENAETDSNDDDLVVLSNDTRIDGHGTIISQQQIGSFVVPGQVFYLTEKDPSNKDYAFRIGDDESDHDGDGKDDHRKYDGISGWGWNKFCTDGDTDLIQTCTPTRPDTDDWIFTAIPDCNTLTPQMLTDVTSMGDGFGEVTLNAPFGLKVVEIVSPSDNLALKAVLDDSGNTLAFAGSTPIASSIPDHDGFARLDFSGPDNEAPKVVKLRFAAPEDRGSQVFINVTDCEGCTLRVDPAMNLFATATGTDATDGVPTSFMLEQSFPNPFTLSTTIRFQLAKAVDVRLSVFDMLGRRVRTLAEGAFSAGVHERIWDGRSDAGMPVSSGLYLYHLEAGSFIQTRQMTILR